MAESLIIAGMRGILGAALLFVASSAFGVVAQENLPDPTRPPSSFAVGGMGSPAASSGPVLQSVLISSGRRIAVINGQTVHVGDKVGEARVAKISEGEVVLNDGKSLQTLKLFPGAEKQRTGGREQSKRR